MYRNQAHMTKEWTDIREITNHLKVAKNAAIKILSAISYFLVSLRPGMFSPSPQSTFLYIKRFRRKK